MGRKIPGKKHRGVKDPLIQHAQREESLKLKVNAPPSKPDDQEIPKSLARVMLLKQLTKEGKFNKKRKRNWSKNKLIDTSRLTGKEMKLPGMTKPDKVLPPLVQRPGEHDNQFMARVGRATEDLINEIKFEEKYSVNVRRHAVSGDVEAIEKRNPDEVDTMFEKKKAELMKPKAKRELKGSELNKLSKSAKFRLKKARKEKLRQEKAGAGENGSHVIDHVSFGEVAHHPPLLTAKPGRAVSGQRQNLLLSSMLGRKDLTVKRKELSMHDRRTLESQRQNVVAAYRKLKAFK